VIGLRQVDEMVLARALWSERIRSAPSRSRQRSAARDDMTPQISGHGHHQVSHPEMYAQVTPHALRLSSSE